MYDHTIVHIDRKHQLEHSPSNHTYTFDLHALLNSEPAFIQWLCDELNNDIMRCCIQCGYISYTSIWKHNVDTCCKNSKHIRAVNYLNQYSIALRHTVYIRLVFSDVLYLRNQYYINVSQYIINDVDQYNTHQ